MHVTTDMVPDTLAALFTLHVLHTPVENKHLTMETEQVLIFLWRRGDLDDGNGKAVGGRGEDSRS